MSSLIFVFVAVEGEPEVLEEDVFQEEAVSCFSSPLNTESIDFPDTPVSLHFSRDTNVSCHSVGSLRFLIFSSGHSVFQQFNFHNTRRKAEMDSRPSEGNGMHQRFFLKAMSMSYTL